MQIVKQLARHVEFLGPWGRFSRAKAAFRNLMDRLAAIGYGEQLRDKEVCTRLHRGERRRGDHTKPISLEWRLA